MDQAIRQQIQRVTQNARQLLEAEFAEQLEGTYDILPDGTIHDDPGAHLNDRERLTRRKLVDAIQHRIAGGKISAEAVADCTREAAFTFLNRFVALKMLEARGLVQQCVSGGELSSGFKEFTGLAPGLAELPDKGYRLYLECLFDELSIEVKILFDRQDVGSLLWPRRQALTDLLTILNLTELDSIWDQDETIGWVYQYFNSSEERKKMREESPTPRDSHELAVRNQFFTPRYVVEFLTDNTLSRIWYEMRQGDTRLKEQCRYLVRRSTEVFLKEGEERPERKSGENLSQEELRRQPVHIPFRAKKDPRELRILDPACGSGHFLLYCFDLLLTIYEEAWHDEQSPESEITGKTIRADYPTSEALREGVPGLILRHNLHGIDIDPRCAQIAAFALWMRAQREFNRLDMDRASRPLIRKTNIVVAEPMPGEMDMLEEFTATLNPPILRQLVEVIFEEMKLAGELGSLLKIEEGIERAVHGARQKWLQVVRGEQLHLFGPRPSCQMAFDFSGITDDGFWGQAEHHIYDVLHSYASHTANAGAFRRRLFSDDTGRGFAFVDRCRDRYDVILMNPPFGAGSTTSRQYLVTAYPNTKQDLYGAFIERGIDLLNRDGLLGAITSRTGFFLKTFQEWRETTILQRAAPIVFADLGAGVLDDAMVETAAYCLQKRCQLNAAFFRLLAVPVHEKAEVLRKAAVEGYNGITFFQDVKAFSRIPRSPFAYWTPRSFGRIFASSRTVKDCGYDVMTGAKTNDDPRFLRLIWEVPIENIGVTREETRQGKGWVRITRGGPFSPFYYDMDSVIDWKNDGRCIKTFVAHYRGDKGWGYNWSANLNGHEWYFLPGLTWPLRGARLSVWPVPAGCLSSGAGKMAFGSTEDLPVLLAIANSRAFDSILRLFAGKVGGVQYEAGLLQQIPVPSMETRDREMLASAAISCWEIKRSFDTASETSHEFLLPALAQVPGSSLRSRAEEWRKRIEHGWAGIEQHKKQIDEMCFALYQMSDADRLSIESEFNPESSEEVGEDMDDHSDGRGLITLVESLLSWAVGVAFGRFDVRRALPSVSGLPQRGVFDPLDACSPGMLTGSDGLPVKGVPGEYPVCVPGAGLLVADPGHNADIHRACIAVVEQLFPHNPSGILDEIAEVLATEDASVGNWLSKRFFDWHSKQYSKSRRCAPIYWQLATPSASYSVWLYYHRFTADTFYRILNDYVKPKVDHEQRKLDRLRAEGGPEATRSLRGEIDQQEAFVTELNIFAEEIERIAPLWSPDLNDGVIINCAPLWRLVPQHKAWQKECKECWDRLVEGDYDWAHLAIHLWPERVVPKCRTDTSLAIAHGLEDMFWQQADKGRWVAKGEPQEGWDAVIERLVAERTSPAVKAALKSLLGAPEPGRSSSNSRRRRRSRA